ncbi:MAG TPA: prepilin-type N-terminal cleavage/methylation domain-containing protein [candidate division Zixibacteria bacterium]|nr:prepilin-type N-terminal cleavage/methylation domain-containing protein [candidate division Zixibacteria bacterium]
MIRLQKRRAAARRRPAFRRLKDEAGVTLLEVMISVVILTIALLGLLGLSMVALEGNQWAHYSTKSTQLLQQKLEELRTAKDPDSGSETIDDIKLSWTVGDMGGSLKKVTVTATWVNQRQQKQSNALSTLMKSDK